VDHTNAEFAFIERSRRRVRGCERLTVPIGDDAACWEFPRPARCLVTTDMLLDGVHFRLGETPPQLVGRKALAVNLSDVAAMAGRPLAAFVSVAFPRNSDPDAAGVRATAALRDERLADGLYDGLLQLADEFGVVVAGGDTNAWDGPLVISVTLIGEATDRGPVTRGGARPGDWIFVTGELGGSMVSSQGFPEIPGNWGRHLTFPPRVNEALRLHEAVALRAMIDLSDGLASDLPHILDESGVGAVLRADAIPVSDAALDACAAAHPSGAAARSAADGRSPLQHALGDGEDFELCFTVSPADGARLLADPPIAPRLSHIGTITAERQCELVDADGNRTPLPRAGWEHRW
jgi:thiamine-monophosphate kinase